MESTAGPQQSFSQGTKLPYVLGVSLILALVGLQIFQFYRYRELEIRNDRNAALLAQALKLHVQDTEQLAQLADQHAQTREKQVETIEQLSQLKQQLAQAEPAKESGKSEPATDDDVMKADSSELKRIYLVWKRQLNEMWVAFESVKDTLEDMKRAREADRQRLAVLSTFSPKNTYGHNMFVGMNAGASVKNHIVAEGDDPSLASFNAALGENALATNQQGHANTAVGADALSTNNDGSMNVALGMRSLANNTAGAGNVAVGMSTMYSNKSGRHNSAVGLQALFSLDDGHDNSAFGRDSMYSNKRGAWNSAFGVDSLPGLENGIGNAAFGGEAGYTEEPNYQLTNGSFNSWFGYQSGPASVKQISNSIAIGYRAKNTDSNQAVIGNADTAETILFGAVKVKSICVGSTCVDEQVLKALLEARTGK
jgi:hypothetical protein